MTPGNKNAINTIFENTFDLLEEQLHSDAKLQYDLGIDSLDRIELVIELEREFNIVIEDHLIESMHTVKDVYSLVSNKTN